MSIPPGRSVPAAPPGRPSIASNPPPDEQPSLELSGSVDGHGGGGGGSSKKDKKKKHHKDKDKEKSKKKVGGWVGALEIIHPLYGFFFFFFWCCVGG